MNVLHVMPALGRAYGGPVSALVGYVAAGAAFGARSVVVGPRCTSADESWLQERLPAEARIVMRGGEGAGPWLAALDVVEAVQDLMRAADVIHVHGLLNATSTLGARTAIHAGRVVVIGPFGTMSRYTFSYRRSLAKRLYFALADAPNLRRASAIHFTTAAEREDAAWHDLDIGGRTFIVPPPYDTAGAERMIRVTERDGPVVLFLGRLHPVKGVELLLEAWGTVRASYPTAELRVAGTGTARYTAFLRERARALGHDGTVRFLGFVADGEKRRQLSDASVLALPSRHENFGIAVLDAIASGVPVVVGTGVQLAPWVEANEVGRVVDRAPEAVGRAIVDALADQALLTRVASCGRGIVERAFGPKAVAPALEAMYRGAVQNAGRAA